MSGPSAGGCGRRGECTPKGDRIRRRDDMSAQTTALHERDVTATSRGVEVDDTVVVARREEPEDDFIARLGRAAKENPASAALVAMGATWLLAGGGRTSIFGTRTDRGSAAAPAMTAGAGGLRAGADKPTGTCRLLRIRTLRGRCLRPVGQRPRPGRRRRGPRALRRRPMGRRGSLRYRVRRGGGARAAWRPRRRT